MSQATRTLRNGSASGKATGRIHLMAGKDHPGSVQFGSCQVSNYWLHDAREFEQLAHAATQILRWIGANETVSSRGGDLIRDCYQIADDAELAQLRGDSQAEERLYADVCAKLIELEVLLGRSRSVARHQATWWMCFRHKMWASAVYHIFAQHLHACGLRFADKALLMSYYTIRIGIAHNERNKDQAISYATRYWDVLLRVPDVRRYPFLG